MDNVNEGNKNKNFKGQHGDENLMVFFRKHWVVLAKDFLYFGVFVIIVAIAILQFKNIQNVLRGNGEMELLFFMGFLAATVYFHRFFVNFLDYFLKIGIITDKRVIDHKKSLFLMDNMDSIDLSNIQNIELIKEGILPAILKYGDIRVFMSASSTVKTFYKVPLAKYYYRRLNEEKEIRQRSFSSNENIKVESQDVPYEQIDRVKAFNVINKEPILTKQADRHQREKAGLKLTSDLKIIPEGEDSLKQS